jgi:hypothetical protein
MVTSGPTTSPLATPTRGKDSRVKKTKLNTVNVFYVDAVSDGRKNHHLGSGIWQIGLSFFFRLRQCSTDFWDENASISGR